MTPSEEVRIYERGQEARSAMAGLVFAVVCAAVWVAVIFAGVWVAFG